MYTYGIGKIIVCADVFDQVDHQNFLPSQKKKKKNFGSCSAVNVHARNNGINTREYCLDTRCL